MVKLILASNSPRRKKIFSDLGLDFEVIPSNYEEKLETDVFSYDLIEDLATQKALDVVRRVGNNEIVIGAIDCLDPSSKREYNLEINNSDYEYLIVSKKTPNKWCLSWLRLTFIIILI